MEFSQVDMSAASKDVSKWADAMAGVTDFFLVVRLV